MQGELEQCKTSKRQRIYDPQKLLAFANPLPPPPPASGPYRPSYHPPAPTQPHTPIELTIYTAFLSSHTIIAWHTRNSDSYHWILTGTIPTPTLALALRPSPSLKSKRSERKKKNPDLFLIFSFQFRVFRVIDKIITNPMPLYVVGRSGGWAFVEPAALALYPRVYGADVCVFKSVSFFSSFFHSNASPSRSHPYYWSRMGDDDADDTIAYTFRGI